MAEVVTQRRHLDTENVVFARWLCAVGHPVRLQVAAKGFREVRHAKRVLKAAVSGAWVHGEGRAELPASAQALEVRRVDDGHEQWLQLDQVVYWTAHHLVGAVLIGGA